MYVSFRLKFNLITYSVTKKRFSNSSYLLLLRSVFVHETLTALPLMPKRDERLLLYHLQKIARKKNLCFQLRIYFIAANSFKKALAACF